MDFGGYRPMALFQDLVFRVMVIDVDCSLPTEELRPISHTGMFLNNY